MSGRISEHPPIPHEDPHTRYVEAGEVVFGIEYRFLRDRRGNDTPPGRGDGSGPSSRAVRDQGVAIHVFGRGEPLKEYFRIDCFKRNPHYHYIWPDAPAQERYNLDRVMTEDVQTWALDVIRHRLSRVMRRVNGPEIDSAKIEAVIPLLEAAMVEAMVSAQ